MDDRQIFKAIGGAVGVAAVVIVAAIVILALEENAPKPPDQVIPDISKVTARLRGAKDSCESRAMTAKAEFRRRQMRGGADVYTDAMSTHNALITRIITSLETQNGSISQSELVSLIDEADATRGEFMRWYQGKQLPPPAGAYGSGDAVLESMREIANIILEVYRIQDARAQQQRAVFREELRACYWRPWQEL